MENTLVITGTRNIALYHLLSMKYALKLECAGLRHSGGSVYAHVKRKFGFKGNKARVLEQLTAHIEALYQAHEV